MGCNNSQEKRDPPQQAMRSVVVFDPATQTTDTVQISADGRSIQNHPSQEVDRTWNGKTIYVYCDDANPTPPTPTHYSISDKVLEDNSPLVRLGTIEVNRYWRQGTARTLYIGRIPEPAAPVPRPRN